MPDLPHPNPADMPGHVAADPPASDAIALLEADHRRIEVLFDAYDRAEPAERQAIASAVCAALRIHARIEEELFYPAMSEATGALDLLAEARVEHAVASDLITALERGRPGDDLFDARMRVLGEYVYHHLIEEEDELFPLCEEAGIDLAVLGEALARRRQELMADPSASVTDMTRS